MRNRKDPFFVISVFALLAGTLSMGQQSSSRTREDSLLELAQRASDTEALSGLRSVELKALARPDADASRKGSTLVLHLKSGGIKKYDDRRECNTEAQETKCERYFLVVHASARHVYVIGKLYYESLEFLVVDDATGEETTLRALPIFSPSGDHLLVLLSNDAQIGFGVQIWSRESHRFSLQWTGSPYADGLYTTYKLRSWPSETTIELEAKTDFVPPKRSMVNYFEVRRRAAGWELVTAH